MARLISHCDPTCFVRGDWKNGTVIISRCPWLTDPIDRTRNFAKYGAIINLLSRFECNIPMARFLTITLHDLDFYTVLLSESKSRIQFRERSELLNDFHGSKEYRLARVVNNHWYASVIKRLSRRRADPIYPWIESKWKRRDLVHLDGDERGLLRY